MVELGLKVPPPPRHVCVLMDIVPVNVPPLLGLDFLDAEQLYADNVTNRLVHRRILSTLGDSLEYEDQWYVPLSRHYGHLHANMYFPHSTFYTVLQLEKLHKQFAHPFAGKLYNLLKVAGLETFDAEMFRHLEDIVARCEPFQRIWNGPRRFRVSIGQENFRFNAEAYIDVMYIDGRPVLYIIDADIRFSDAIFLPKVTTDAVWEALFCVGQVCRPDSRTVFE